MFDVDLVSRILAERGPFFSLSHFGHGANSYGLNLVTAAGPIAAFMQHHYGGAYANPVRDLIGINSTYSRLHVLFRPVERRDGVPLRWLMIYSEFRGGGGIVDLDKVRGGSSAGAALERLDEETELFKAAAGRIEGFDAFFHGRPVF